MKRWTRKWVISEFWKQRVSLSARPSALPSLLFRHTQQPSAHPSRSVLFRFSYSKGFFLT